MQAFLERYTGRDERFFSPMDTGDGGPVALQVRRSGLVWFGLVWFGLGEIISSLVLSSQSTKIEK